MTIKNLEFDLDGVLPSSDPEIFFGGAAETSVFSVGAGLLDQTTFGIGTGSPLYASTGVSLSSTLSTVMEVRLSISQIEGSGGAYFEAYDGSNRYAVFFSAGAALVQSDSGTVAVPIADLTAFHTYRIESPGNSSALNFFVDGTLALSTTAPSDTLNFFAFGDAVTLSGNNADASWDYVRVSQVPEPSTAAVLGLGLAGLAVRRRAHCSSRTA